MNNDLELIEQTKTIDTSMIEGVYFTSGNGKIYTILLDPIKKIAVYISRKYGKTNFAPQELIQERDILLNGFESGFSAEDCTLVVSLLNEWIENGGKFELILRKSTLSQEKNNTQYMLVTSQYQEIKSVIAKILPRKSIVIFISILVFILGVLSIYLFTTDSGVLGDEFTINKSSGKLNIKVYTGTLIGENLELLDSLTISEKNRQTSEVYMYDGRIVYSIVNSSSKIHDLPYLEYYFDQKKLFNTTDYVHLYSINSGKLTYSRLDKDKKGYLYINNELVSTNEPSKIKINGRNMGNYNSFNYQILGGRYVYISYTTMNTYRVNIGGKLMRASFSSHPKVFFINNEYYIVGTQSKQASSSGMYSIYRGDNYIGSSNIDIVPVKIGNTIAYQVDNNGVFELYFGNEKIATQNGRSIQFKEINGKVIYDIYDISTDQTILYLDNEIIAKIDSTSNINGLKYGEKDGKLYYSYKVSATKSITYIDGTLYDDIESFEFVQGKLAYIQYNLSTKVNDLYYDGLKIADGVISSSSFGDINGKLYYVIYSRSEKKYQLYIGDKLINSSDTYYHFIKGKKGLYYSTFNKSTKLNDVYLNSVLLVSGKQDIGFLESRNHLVLEKNEEGIEDVYVYYREKRGLPYSLYLDSEPIGLNGLSEPRIVQGAHVKDIFYTSGESDSELKIYVYQINE